MKILLTFFLLTAPFFSANAHKLYLLTFYEAGSLNISSYFSDGTKCTGCGFTVTAADGTVLAEDKLDEKGEAAIIKDFPVPFTVSIDAGMGHSARTEIKKAEGSDGEAPQYTLLEIPESSGEVILNERQIRNMIRQELAKQTVEINAAIGAGRSQTDKIIAGIGYLFGIFGLFMLFKRK